jgi:hypothetical protein
VISTVAYLQVLQDVAEQLAQLSDEFFMRLLPPPMPNAETSLRISRLPHPEQVTPFSPPIETRTSNCRPHSWQ